MPGSALSSNDQGTWHRLTFTTTYSGLQSRDHDLQWFLLVSGEPPCSFDRMALHLWFCDSLNDYHKTVIKSDPFTTIITEIWSQLQS